MHIKGTSQVCQLYTDLENGGHCHAGRFPPTLSISCVISERERSTAACAAVCDERGAQRCVLYTPPSLDLLLSSDSSHALLILNSRSTYPSSIHHSCLDFQVDHSSTAAYTHSYLHSNCQPVPNSFLSQLPPQPILCGHASREEGQVRVPRRGQAVLETREEARREEQEPYEQEAGCLVGRGAQGALRVHVSEARKLSARRVS